jgi:hypothetical protein
MPPVAEYDFPFSQVFLRYLEELRNEIATCAHDLALSRQDLISLRLLDPDQTAVVNLAAHDIAGVIDIQDAMFDWITEILTSAALRMGGPA